MSVVTLVKLLPKLKIQSEMHNFPVEIVAWKKIAAFWPGLGSGDFENECPVFLKHFNRR